MDVLSLLADATVPNGAPGAQEAVVHTWHVPTGRPLGLWESAPLARNDSPVALALSADGLRVTSRETLFHGRFGRLRDVLVAPDGTVYLATSNKFK